MTGGHVQNVEYYIADESQNGRVATVADRQRLQPAAPAAPSAPAAPLAVTGSVLLLADWQLSTASGVV